MNGLKKIRFHLFYCLFTLHQGDALMLCRHVGCEEATANREQAYIYPSSCLRLLHACM